MEEKVEFTTSIEINANPSKVWSIFTDTSKYSQWNPFIKTIWGKFALGERFFEIGYVADHIYMPFPMTVKVYRENKELTYEGSLPGFFGHHVYSFQEISEGKTVFSHAASFSGFFVQKSKDHIKKDVKRVHGEMNLALKNRAEG